MDKAGLSEQKPNGLRKQRLQRQYGMLRVLYALVWIASKANFELKFGGRYLF